MIYLLLIYIVFQVVYDNWIPDNETGGMIYFAFQYGWIAALAIIQALKGKQYIFYYSFALIMLITMLCEITSNGKSQTSPGVTWYNISVLVLLILSLIKWTGLKRIFGRHC
jgi:hypothetical protein